MWCPRWRFRPDSRTLATGSYDQTIKLWNVESAELIRTLNGHTNWVFAVAFSPDGKTLASGGYDKSIRLWNVADGEPKGVLEGHTAAVRSLAFSPDGKHLISGSSDRTVRTLGFEITKIRNGTQRPHRRRAGGDVLAGRQPDCERQRRQNHPLLESDDGRVSAGTQRAHRDGVVFGVLSPRPHLGECRLRQFAPHVERPKRLAAANAHRASGCRHVAVVCSRCLGDRHGQLRQDSETLARHRSADSRLGGSQSRR